MSVNWIEPEQAVGLIRLLFLAHKISLQCLEFETGRECGGFEIEPSEKIINVDCDGSKAGIQKLEMEAAPCA